MKQLVLQLQTHPTFAKVWHWVKLIAITGGAQAVVQATGLLSGILIIRLLPVEEYALYTLANTMLGTMTVLADGGISTGVMAEGGKVWQDKEKLGTVIATGLDLRRKFAIVSLLVSIPILVYLLQNHGASGLMTLLIIASLIPAFFAALSDSLLQVAPKLHQEIVPLQKNQMTVSIIRLLLSGLTLFIFPWTFVALLANGIATIYGNLKLRNIVNKLAFFQNPPDTIIKESILKIVKRRLPEMVYYCLSGQINIWLLSLFGTTSAIAGLGALGRLGTVFNFFTVIINILIIPRIARMKYVKNELLKYTLFVIFILFIFSILVTYFSFFYSTNILKILGPQYLFLNKELLFTVCNSCVYMLLGFVFSVNLSRGWIINPYVYITISITSTVFAFFLFAINQLLGVVLFSLSVSLIQFFTLFFYFIVKVYSDN